jgi:NAD(P)-dependent dehydrogenase (short-subunit alcohol dehydrogenase family)
MNYGIAGRTALVVVGSKGIGLQAAMMLAAEGARVAIVARTQKHIDRAVASIIANGGEAIGVSADMGSPDGIESAVTEVRERLAPPASVADEYARFGITINTVAPGWIATEKQSGYLTGHYITVDGGLHRSAF